MKQSSLFTWENRWQSSPYTERVVLSERFCTGVPTLTKTAIGDGKASANHRISNIRFRRGSGELDATCRNNAFVRLFARRYAFNRVAPCDDQPVENASRQRTPRPDFHFGGVDTPNANSDILAASDWSKDESVTVDGERGPDNSCRYLGVGRGYVVFPPFRFLSDCASRKDHHYSCYKNPHFIFSRLNRRSVARHQSIHNIADLSPVLHDEKVGQGASVRKSNSHRYFGVTA